MKRLKPGTLVYVEARDWSSDPTWQHVVASEAPAPLGWIAGRVIKQDDSTLYIAHCGFYESSETDCTKIPTGCIEAIHPICIVRDALFVKKKRKP